jgi:hypothetical protein
MERAPKQEHQEDKRETIQLVDKKFKVLGEQLASLNISTEEGELNDDDVDMAVAITNTMISSLKSIEKYRRLLD